MISRPVFQPLPELFPELPCIGKSHVWVLINCVNFTSRLSPPDSRHAIKDARDSLEWLLRGYLNLDVGTLTIKRAVSGKPFHEGVEFSVSHAGAVSIFAFTRVGAVGVDVESLERKVNARAIAKRYFQPPEVGRLASLNEKEHRSEFIRMWTAKEAAVKLSGVGMARGLQDVSCDFSHSDPVVMHLGRRVYLQEFPVGEEHWASLASWEPLSLNFFSLPQKRFI
jgi:phosphopantetheinyl transferase